nr:hypothetical protein [Halolamina pelagica]
MATFVDARPFIEAFVVTQTPVELTGMVVLTRVVPAWLVPGPSDQSLNPDVGKSG